MIRAVKDSHLDKTLAWDRGWSRSRGRRRTRRGTRSDRDIVVLAETEEAIPVVVSFLSGAGLIVHELGSARDVRNQSDGIESSQEKLHVCKVDRLISRIYAFFVLAKQDVGW
jgi:hypothetical protein